MLKLQNLSKSYGGFYAVRDVTLRVEPGEIFGFLGVNGAGKTSTLRMIAGILLPSAGSITIGDFDIVKQPIEAKRLTGYIPDRPHLYGKLKARELLEFSAELYSIPLKVAKPRIDSLLEEYGLAEKQHQLTESFSHGMKQRLATCLALVHEPKLLVVDEPMVGLDPHGAKLLKSKFLEYRNAGITMFLSTHSLNVAQEVCDRLAIIQNGSIIASGTMQQLLESTKTDHSNLEQAFMEITTAPEYTVLQ
jgi:ABC-2 type transport system ATP-binding protein